MASLLHEPPSAVEDFMQDGNCSVASELTNDGTWLNSNMPDFKPELPDHKLLSLSGEDGQAGARSVAFTGYCIGGEDTVLLMRQALSVRVSRTACHTQFCSLILSILEVPGSVRLQTVTELSKSMVNDWIGRLDQAGWAFNCPVDQCRRRCCC